MYFLPRFFLLLILLSSLAQCRNQEDPRLAQLQKDVRNLAAENKNLRTDLQRMQKEIQTRAALVPSPQSATSQTTPAPPEPQMTVDQMKIQLQPLLTDFTQKLVAAGSTPRKGSQYGMKIEYDLTKAVYGLIENNDPDEPYRGKVIVPYKKYLESEKNSKSYGEGTTQFIFSFQDGQWSLQSFQ